MRNIAVVGMACRLPGGLNSIGELHEALLGKVNTAQDVPADRWSGEWFYSEDEAAPAKAYVRKGNFVSQDLRTFDASFFDLPPQVAENLDPQQRLMLEVVWEAFENAGVPLPQMAGKQVGVYVGGFMLDHMITNMNPENASLINQNTAAGMMMTMLSNRISHAYDLRGPSLSIDTACSSSMTAFNYGCRDIWNGTCDVAMVGGVNSMMRPEYPVGMSKGQFLARDGQCKSFDERGDGYGRGEGAGAIILKEYERALADGDEILAKVVATGVNSDGRTPGISMPSGEAQEQLIRDVCDEFSIDPKTIHFVECHGTGTAIGDPTEAGSIGRVFGAGRTGDDKVAIGSIKSNIGHTEALAGVAGVIKAVLSLKNRQAYPLANLETPNSKIPFDDLGLRLSDALIPLGKEGDTLRAAVNSFGYGGTNAHAIFESVDEEAAAPAKGERSATLPQMMPFSARSDAALKARASQMAEFLKTDANLDDVLSTATHRSAHLSNRAVVMGDSREDMIKSLETFAEEGNDPSIATGSVPFSSSDKPVFVYTGMGPQWWAMGQELYKNNSVYRAALDEGDAIFKEVSGFSILEEMLKDEKASEITKTELAQPANFMVQLGVTALLKDAGVTPGAIIGHSVGEVGSAYSAGALTLRDAMIISYHRSRTQAKTAHTGTMLAIGQSLADVKPYLDEVGGKIDIAAVNGPSTITVSGDTVAIHSLAEKLTKAEIFNRVLTVEVPYHSYLMDPITDELIESLSDIKPSVPTIPLISTVTGELVEDVSYDGPYWADNVRQPVSFMKGLNVLLEQGYSTFIEVGPHPVLSSAIRDCARASGKDVRLVETLRRGTDKRPSRFEPEAIAHAVASTFASGTAIDWTRIVPQAGRVMLPNYPWQREKYWLETDTGIEQRLRTPTQPLLGYRKTSAFNVWTQEHSQASLAYLFDHVVTGVAVMPAAGYVEQILELGHLMHEDADGIDVRNLEIASPLILQSGRPQDTMTYYDPTVGGVAIRSAQSGSTGNGTLHVTADVGAIKGDLMLKTDLNALKSRFTTTVETANHYARLSMFGLQYGPYFQPLREMFIDRDAKEALGYLTIGEELGDVSKYRLHPSLLDGCFQLLMGILPEDSGLYLPTGFKSIRVLCDKTPTKIWCHGTLSSMNAKQIICDLTITDENGNVVADIRGMEATAASNRGNQRVDSTGATLIFEENETVWRPADAVGEPRRLGRWLVIGSKKDALAEEIGIEVEEFGAFEAVNVEIGSKLDLSSEPMTVRSDQMEDFSALLEKVGQLNGIAALHGLTAGENDVDPTGELAVEALASLTKALAATKQDELPRVYCVTKNAFAADGSSVHVNPAQTAIAGFNRVAHNELPAANFSLVDVPAKLDDTSKSAMVAELLGDMKEDEVALRGTARLYCVIVDTDVAMKPVTRDMFIAEDTVYRVRGNDDPEQDGMVSIVDHELPELGDDDVRLAVSNISMSSSVLQDGSRVTLDEALVPVVALVEQAGKNVADLEVGGRVFGYAPADFASHLQARRDEMFLTALDEDVDPEDALEALDVTVRAEFAAATSGLGEGETALVLDSDPVAQAIADALEENHVAVTRLGTDTELEMTAIEGVISKAGQSFDAIVAPMSRWVPEIGTAALSSGGVLVDCDKDAGAVRITSDISGIIRSDLNVITGRPKRLVSVLTKVAADLAAGKSRTPTSLPSNLVDVVYRSFDLPPVEVRIDMTFDLEGARLPVQVKRKVEFEADGTYLITGGLGGFGQKTASWLVAHGAGCVVLASRSGANTPAKEAFIAGLEARGARVEAPKYDLADRKAVDDMIGWIKKDLPPLKGVYHSAAVIEDQEIVEMDLDTYRRVMRSKATAAWALHEATAGIELDQFVLYSSIANVVGNRRQAAYSAANGYLDGLAWHRHALGLPALSVNWGAISDVGFVADNKETEEFLRFMGIGGLSTTEALERLGIYLTLDVPQISSAVMSSWENWARYENFGSKSPRFVEKLEAAGVGGNSEAREQLVAELMPLPELERAEVLSGLIAEVIGSELRQEGSSLPLDRPINDLGVDSLMAAEIQLILERDLGIGVAVMDLLGGATIRAITDQNMIELELNSVKAAE